MKNTLKVLSILVLVVGLLVGCSAVRDLNYDGKTYRTHELEELIEDKIEDENPGFDCEVSIVEETEKKKTKKKRK